jgi:hypothetical protein
MWIQIGKTANILWVKLQGKSSLHGNQLDVQHKRTILQHHCSTKFYFASSMGMSNNKVNS